MSHLHQILYTSLDYVGIHVGHGSDTCHVLEAVHIWQELLCGQVPVTNDGGSLESVDDGHIMALDGGRLGVRRDNLQVDSGRLVWKDESTGIILGMGSANEGRRYIVTPPLIVWVHIQSNPRGNLLCSELIEMYWSVFFDIMA